jgi:glucose-6-phosphate 1-dehydrogenase
MNTIFREEHPTTLVIMGATGDLAQHKLYPALLDLFLENLLPVQLRIVCFSRRPFTHDAFRLFVKSALESANSNHTTEETEAFLGHIFYVAGDLNELTDYEKLATFLGEYDTEISLCTNKLFYLAVPPSLYEGIFEKLSRSGLTIPCASGAKATDLVWTRVLVEKPFGNSAEEAQKLDLLLGSLFQEKQIFRIDHYLAKETIQNILAFRFSNELFEPVWNAAHVEKIEIRVLEKNTVGDRGSFYDGIGALVDVGQNHLLQMLTLITMENPGSLTATELHSARSTLLSSIQLPPHEEQYFERGQYNGYREEPGVSENSTIETYFKAKLAIDLPRWKGVPLYIESGKALAESGVDIKVFFKEGVHSLCPPACTEHQNILTFNIQPTEAVSIVFWKKKPGFDFSLLEVPLSFSYTQEDLQTVIPDAYERVLFDCIRGDQSLFTTTQEVLEEWRIITSIRDVWGTVPVRIYEKGTMPEARSKNN